MGRGKMDSMRSVGIGIIELYEINVWGGEIGSAP